MADSTPNMSDFLVNQMFNTAQANSAKSGGYGRGGLPQVFGSLLQAGAAAFPNSPLLQFAGNMVQGANVRAYNREMLRQYDQAQRQAQRAQQDEMNDNLAIAGATTGGIPNYRGKQRLTTEEINNLRQIAANPDIDNLMRTGQFQMTNRFGDHGDIPGTLLKRGGEALDARETMNQLPKFMADSPIGGGLVTSMTENKPPQTQQAPPKPGQGIPPAGLDYSDRPLTAGATVQQPPIPFVTPGNAFTVGIPNVPNLLTGRKNEQDNRNTQYSNKTTRDHYGRSDQLARDVYKATVNNQGGYGRNAPSGPAFSLNEQMWRSMSPEQQQAWLENTANGKTGSGKDQYGEQLAQNAHIAKAAYGEKSPEAQAAAQEYQDYIRQSSPGNKRAVQSLNFDQAASDLLNNPAAQFMNGGAFKGQSRQKLTQATQNLRGPSGRTYNF